MLDVPSWVTGLAGAALGFSLASLRDAMRNRRRLDVHLAGGMVFYAVPPDGLAFGIAVQDPERDWFTCEPEDAQAHLFVRLDLRLVNRSYLDDAITEAFLFLVDRDDTAAAQPALTREFQYFYGENVPAHSLRHLRLKFTFDRERYGQFSRWTRADTLNLRLNTVRGRTYRIAVPIPGLTSRLAVETRVTNLVLDE